MPAPLPFPTRRDPQAPDHTEWVMSGDVRLAVKHWGNPRQPTLVLVHGYPDNSEVWHAVAQRLAADFHVVAYDVRGAGQSDRPRHRADYQLDRLHADLSAVIDHVSPTRAVHVVAHDWGSVQAWESVTEPAMAGRIASFTSCSGPCLDHMGYWFRDRLRQPTPRHLGQVLLQSLRSWYIVFFQLPWLPEALWRGLLARHWPVVVRWLEGVEVPPRATQKDDACHGIWLYRANMWPRLTRPRERHAHCPVQVLVPRRDLYVAPALTADLGRWVPQLWRREFDAGHWMPLSHPREMAGAVRRFVHFVDRQQLSPRASGAAAGPSVAAPRSCGPV